jgi:UDP-N-acetylmuramoyl-L-alanyl-D-glutamate--2,6-diaminopimelate ligase
MFCRYSSSISDGHDYIQKAIELGAVAIVCDNFLIYSKMELLTCK